MILTAPVPDQDRSSEIDLRSIDPEDPKLKIEADIAFCSQWAGEVIECVNRHRLFGRIIRPTTLRKLTVLLEVLWALTNTEEKMYVRDEDGIPVTCFPYHVHLSWELIRQACEETGLEVSHRHVQRLFNDLEVAGFAQRIHIDKGEAARNNKLNKGVGKSRYEFKAIRMIPFELPNELLEKSERVGEELIRLANASDATTPARKKPRPLRTDDSADFGRPKSSCHAISTPHTTAIHSSPRMYLDDNSHQTLSSNSGEGWSVCFTDDLTKKRRHCLATELPPPFFNQQQYATWVQSREDERYVPWIIWDIDGDKNLQDPLADALERTRPLVKRLLHQGAPMKSLAVIFTGNRGFHVYLDSRVVNHKPGSESDVMSAIRSFCRRIAPDCDMNIYKRNQLLGQPGSLHRREDRRAHYATIPIDQFLTESLEEIREWSLAPGDGVKRAESMHPVPALVRAFQSPVQQLTRPAIESSRVAPARRGWRPQGVAEGERDVTLFKLISQLVRSGVPEHEARNEAFRLNDLNRPPLPSSVVEYKLRRAYHLN